MKTRFLVIIAAFLVLSPWLTGLTVGINNEVMVDGITFSATIVMSLTLAFSLVSWFLFSWASRDIKLEGIPLAVISGSALVIPFLQVLGPMAGIILGVVAGFAAFMIQKKITNPANNSSMRIASIIFAATYVLLIAVVLTFQSPGVWETGNGIGSWTGTAQGIEHGLAEPFRNVGLLYFFTVIPTLIVTGLVVRMKN